MLVDKAGGAERRLDGIHLAETDAAADAAFGAPFLGETDDVLAGVDVGLVVGGAELVLEEAIDELGFLAAESQAAALDSLSCATVILESSARRSATGYWARSRPPEARTTSGRARGAAERGARRWGRRGRSGGSDERTREKAAAVWREPTRRRGRARRGGDAASGEDDAAEAALCRFNDSAAIDACMVASLPGSPGVARKGGGGAT